MRRRLIIVLILLAAIAIAAIYVLNGPVPSRNAEIPPSSPDSSRKSVQPDKGLRPDLAKALGYGEATTWDSRIDLIRSLPPKLNTAETEALLSAFAQPPAKGVSPADSCTYMHEIACVLQRRDEVRERFVQALIAISRDTGRDAVTRDYAFQHLREAWTRSAGNAKLRESISAALRDCVEHDQALAASALLTMHLLATGSDATQAAALQDNDATRSVHAANFELPDSQFIPLVQPILAAKTSRDNMPARLTALRIIGDRHLKAFREPVLGILKDRSEHTLVRMAAVNAYAQVAEPSELEALASLDVGNPTITSVARTAIQSRAKH